MKGSSADRFASTYPLPQAQPGKRHMRAFNAKGALEDDEDGDQSQAEQAVRVAEFSGKL